MGGGHICGNNFFRKYAPPQKFSPQNWQIYVIFLHLKCHFFCDVNKLPNLHDYAKTSPKNSLRKHRENFFRKYAPLFIEGGGIIAEITVHCFCESALCTAVRGRALQRWWEGRAEAWKPPSVQHQCIFLASKCISLSNKCISIASKCISSLSF